MARSETMSAVPTKRDAEEPGSRLNAGICRHWNCGVAIFGSRTKSNNFLVLLSFCALHLVVRAVVRAASCLSTEPSYDRPGSLARARFRLKV